MNQTLSTDRRGIAETLGIMHPRIPTWGLSMFEVGLLVDYCSTAPEADKRETAPLPPGHRFFHDCDRETNARKIEWLMARKGVDSWFVTLTFKSYISERRAFLRLGRWLYAITQAHTAQIPSEGGFGGGRLNWCVATEWQKRNVIHFHLILSGVRLGDLSRKRWECRWEAGQVEGFARILDAVHEAAPYLAKYTIKGREGQLRWHLASRGTTVPSAVTCCRA